MTEKTKEPLFCLLLFWFKYWKKEWMTLSVINDIKANLRVNMIFLCKKHRKFPNYEHRRISNTETEFSTLSPSSQSDSAVMGGTVNSAWWWSALGEGARVSHLCCLCAASLAASSIHRLKGGVRRQMLNDSLKATAPALISSPVCAGCHSNWPEHLKGWVTLQYILAHELLEEFIEHIYQ